MATTNEPQRMLLTFRRNGDSNGKRLVEITAEPLEQHEAPAGASRQSWFGAEDDVATILEGLEFSAFDVEGVIGALHTNRDATRELDVLPSDLVDAGFSASAPTDCGTKPVRRRISPLGDGDGEHGLD